MPHGGALGVDLRAGPLLLAGPLPLASPLLLLVLLCIATHAADALLAWGRWCEEDA
jgi:hypothetical protein